MEDVVQIRVGEHMTGIIGWKAALDEVAGRCEGMSDEQVGKALLEILSKRNYIPAGIVPVYEAAFVREYKRSMGQAVAETDSGRVRIKVLGQGCPQCDRLEQEVMDVMAETGIAADLDHVRDIAEIGRYGVLGTPALVIDDKVRAVGSVPPKAGIKAWLEQAAGEKNREPKNG